LGTPPEKPWVLDNEQVVLLKNYLHMGDASETEIKSCLEVARRYRLDPFKQGQIWFIKRWNSSAVNAQGTKGAHVWIPQTGVYGLAHIASRDYKDFGSIGEPEYGPMITMEVENHKFQAPEWCKVKVYKKGIAEPTVATIYFEEFCPGNWKNVEYFWARMPRNQIAKCAKAQAIRFAYPDLGGLYIPEEMEKSAGDFTPDGRQILEGAPSGTREAAQAVAQEKVKKLQESLNSPTKPVVSASKAESGSAGEIEIDWVNGPDKPARLIGDIGELIEGLKDTFVFEHLDGWWWLLPKDADRFIPICKAEGYKVTQTLPQPPPEKKDSGKQQRGGKAPAGQQGKGKAANGEPAPPDLLLVTGTIDRVQTTQTSNKAVMAYVTVIDSGRKKISYGTFDKDIIDILTKVASKPIVCRIYVKTSGKYQNIVGLANVGSQEYVDGKVPVTSVNREPGGSLFK
jgi:hypothetical protein